MEEEPALGGSVAKSLEADFESPPTGAITVTPARPAASAWGLLTNVVQSVLSLVRGPTAKPDAPAAAGVVEEPAGKGSDDETEGVMPLLDRVLAAKHFTEGWTALHAASMYGNLKCVKVLLEFGADAALEDVDGANTAAVALEYGHVDVFEDITTADSSCLSNCSDACGHLLWSHAIAHTGTWTLAAFTRILTRLLSQPHMLEVLCAVDDETRDTLLSQALRSSRGRVIAREVMATLPTTCTAAPLQLHRALTHYDARGFSLLHHAAALDSSDLLKSVCALLEATAPLLDEHDSDAADAATLVLHRNEVGMTALDVCRTHASAVLLERMQALCVTIDA